MPELSLKAQKMPESPIRRLVPYAEKAKKAGKTVYQLNIGQPDIATPDVALSAIKNCNLKVVEYSHSAGFASYREKLATYYNKHNILVSADNLLITTGGSEALLFSIMSCINPGDEMIVPEPFYANYNGFSVAAGATIKPITASIKNGFALPPIDEFEKLISPKTKAILICNPVNPTGYLYTQQELNALKTLALKHDLFLIADEVYREFVYDGQKHLSTFELGGLDQHLIMVDSVSKRYSMCGARVGVVVTKNRQVYNSVLKFAQARLSPPTFGQIAAEAALEVDNSYFEKVKNEYTRRRNLMVELLQKIPGVVCPKPGGAFYTVAQLPVDDAEEFCKWMLSEFSLDNATVMLAPACGFYSTPHLGKKEVRIAYVLEEAKLHKAMQCIKEGLEVYAGVQV